MFNNKMKLTCSVFLSSVVSLLLPTFAQAALDGIPDNCEYSEKFAEAQGGYTCRGWYAGLGLGLSFIEPELGGDLTDTVDNTVHALIPNIYAGYDFNHNWGAEIQYSNLNAATFETGVVKGLKIKYDYIGVSGLFHFKNHLPTSGGPLPGLNGYAKFGIGKLLTSVKEQPESGLVVNHNQKASMQVHFGFGAEYMRHDGWGVRAEYLTNDKDAAELTVSILNRISRVIDPVVPVPVLPPVAKKPVVLLVPAICNAPTGIMEGVEFIVDSAKLTKSATVLLDGIVLQLADYSKVELEVRAHTDSDAPADYNQQLSEDRAKSVKDYLYARGLLNIESFGFGETQPIVENNTDENKARNRRVEIEILSNECDEK
ncbi:MAG: OmpA family protein [Saccharospirillaceae bacterium]|nr:OmpA family protein [Saccharospirillaceae bacterium]